jgi:hypothetical protein
VPQLKGDILKYSNKFLTANEIWGSRCLRKVGVISREEESLSLEYKTPRKGKETFNMVENVQGRV